MMRISRAGMDGVPIGPRRKRTLQRGRLYIYMHICPSAGSHVLPTYIRVPSRLAAKVKWSLALWPNTAPCPGLGTLASPSPPPHAPLHIHTRTHIAYARRGSGPGGWRCGAHACADLERFRPAGLAAAFEMLGAADMLVGRTGLAARDLYVVYVPCVPHAHHVPCVPCVVETATPRIQAATP